MFLIKLVISLILILVLIKSANGAKHNCNSTAFEACVNRFIMFGDETFVYPTNMKQMQKRCKELKILDRCTKNYAQNCLKGEARNSIKVILYGVSKSNRNYCTKKVRKNEMISFGKCANENKKDILRAVNNLNRELHGIQTYKDSKERMNMVCCSYIKCKHSILEAAGECSESERNKLESLIDSYASDALNLLCNDYTENSDRCSTLVHKIPKWNKPLKQKVFFLSIVDILNGL